MTIKPCQEQTYVLATLKARTTNTDSWSNKLVTVFIMCLPNSPTISFCIQAHF